MKILLALTILVFGGCRTATPIAPLPLPAKSVPEPRPIAVTPAPAATPPPTAALEQKIRQQTQLIEALISQNDALTAKLAAIPPPAEPRAIMASNAPTPSAQPLPVTPPAAPVSPPGPAVAPAPAAELLLLPNADGIIDLAAASATTPPGEPTNPFVMRAVPPEAMREISLHVGGIIAGPVPCAVINDRLVQSGETIESFADERIEYEAVFLRHGEHRLRLPVAE